MTFDGSAIDGFSRVQESDVLARPDAKTFQILPWHPDEAPVARVFCDIFNLDGTPVRGLPPPRPAPQPRPRPGAGLHLLRLARDRVLLLRQPRPLRTPVTLDTGLVLRAHRHRRGQRPAQAQRAHPGGDGHPRRARPARGRAQPARDRPALHRRAHHGRHRDDGAARGQGDRPAPRRARQLHAQAPHRRAGIGHAHPPVAVRGRHQRLLRPRRPLRAVGGGQALHRRPAAPRPRDHRRHQPVGQLLQAARGRATRRPSTCRGPATTARRSSGCR